MDKGLLSKMLLELLPGNDVVGLPGLGCFVSEYVGASFSDKGFTINPPYRHLEFREDAAEDTLLAEMYAKSNSTSIDKAREIISDFASEIKEELSGNHVAELPGLGMFRSTRGDRVFFVASEGLDIFPDTAFLEPISLKNHGYSVPEVPYDGGAVTADVESTLVEENVPAAESKPDEESKRGHGRTILMAALILLTAAVVLFSTFIVLCEVAPDFIDSILYTEEELAIINY